MNKKLNATLSLTIFALLSLIFCSRTFAEQPPDNVQGNWTIYSTNVENGEVVIKHVQIAQYGNRITGYFEGPNQSGPIEGKVDVHHIMFSTVTRNVLTFRGQIYGDNMTGTCGVHGKHAPWQAVRTTGIGAAPQAVIGNAQPVLVPTQEPQPQYTSYAIASPSYSAPQQSYAQQPNAYSQQPALLISARSKTYQQDSHRNSSL